MRFTRTVLPLLLLTAEALLFFGCARRPIQIENVPLPSVPSLVSRIHQNKNELRDFSGAGSIELSSPDLRRTVLGLRLDYLIPYYRSLEFKGPLGVQVGSLVLAGDYYNLTVNSDHIKSSGRISEFEYPPGLDLLVGSANIRDLFEPLIAVTNVPDSARLMKDLSCGQFLLVWPESDGDHRLWVDPYQPLILQELITTTQGDTLWLKTVSGVKQRGGVFLPNHWKIVMGHGEELYQIKLRLSQIEINTGLSPEDFPIAVDSSEAFSE